MLSLTRVKQAATEFIKVLRLGKNDVQTSLYVFPFGFSGKAVNETLAVHAKTMQKGDSVVVGYVLEKDETTNVGESRLYSTDSDGNVVAEIICRNDGTAEILGNDDNMVRFSELKTAYDQLKNDHDSLVSAFNQHVHPTAAVGSPSPPTPVPNVIPATPSTGDISNAKIDEVKTLSKPE